MAAEKLDEALRQKLERHAELRVQLAKNRLETASADRLMGQDIPRTPERDLEKAQAAVDLKKAQDELAAVRQNLQDAATRPPAEANERMRGMWEEHQERELDEARADAAKAKADAEAPLSGGVDAYNTRMSNASFAQGRVENLEQEQAEERDEPARERIRGCAPKVIAAVGVVLAVVALVVFLKGGDSEETKAVVAGVEQGGGQGGGGAAGFAGHYTLVEGLDDPTGIDASGQGSMATGSASTGSATIDIDDSGKVTGGSYHASADVNGCHSTGDGTGASGSVAASGVGAVTFTVQHTRGGGSCQSESFAFNMAYQFGIVDGQLFMCRSDMATPNTCAAAYPRLVAKFAKQS